MFAYELPEEPNVDRWEDYQKPLFIKKKIEEVCEDIFCRLDKSHFEEIYDLLREHIEDNIEKYLPNQEQDHVFSIE